MYIIMLNQFYVLFHICVPLAETSVFPDVGCTPCIIPVYCMYYVCVTCTPFIPTRIRGHVTHTPPNFAQVTCTIFYVSL